MHLKQNIDILFVGKFFNELDALDYNTKALDLIKENMQKNGIKEDQYLIADTAKALEVFQALKPRILVLLGAFSFNIFIEKLKYPKAAKELGFKNYPKKGFSKNKETYFIVTHHPSYILQYAPELQQKNFIYQLKLASKLSKGNFKKIICKIQSFFSACFRPISFLFSSNK